MAHETRVTVSDVARETEVADQTVYNYFQTKEQLVTDRDQQIQDRLCGLIRSRPPAVTPAAAIRDFVLKSVAGIRSIPPEIWRGEFGYLAAISPTVQRLALELTHRQAAALASAISETTAVSPEVAKLHGIALASVFQIIISEATAGSASQDRRTCGNRVSCSLPASSAPLRTCGRVAGCAPGRARGWDGRTCLRGWHQFWHQSERN